MLIYKLACNGGFQRLPRERFAFSKTKCEAQPRKRQDLKKYSFNEKFFVKIKNVDIERIL